MEGKTNRLLALEGLRGIAAVAVVFYHCLLVFYPALFFGKDYYVDNVHRIHFENILAGSPFTVFLSGTFSVSIFFIISGFVLTIGFFQGGDQKIIKRLAAKRYPRLMLPALVSVLIVWLLLAFGLNVNKDHAQIITQSLWLQSNWHMLVPNLGNAISEGVVGIVTGSTALYYNAVLWTLSYELIGSVLVFAIALIFKESKYRWLIYLILFLFTYTTWYAGFIVGMILADLYSSKHFPFSTIKRTPLMVGGLVVGLFLGGYPSSLMDTKLTVYKSLSLGWLDKIQNQTFYLTVGAALVLIAVLTVAPLTRFFESKIMRTLGKYSFSLYLVHTSIIFVICTGLFMILVPTMGYNKAAILAIIGCIPAIALVTFFFEKYVDRPSVRISGIFANWLFGTPQASLVSDDPQIGFVAPRNSFVMFMQKSVQRLRRR